MKTRVLLFLLFVGTVLSIGTLITVVFNSAPSTAEIISLFYLAVAGTVFGLSFFGVYGLSALRLQALPDWQSTTLSLRIGLVVAAFVVATLSIQSVNYLNLATFIILLLLAIATELIMRKRFSAKRS